MTVRRHRGPVNLTRSERSTPRDLSGVYWLPSKVLSDTTRETLFPVLCSLWCTQD